MYPEITVANKNQLPKITNGPSEVGRFQGIGLPAKHGSRPGTFTKKLSPKPGQQLPRAVPPLKFN